MKKSLILLLALILFSIDINGESYPSTWSSIFKMYRSPYGSLDLPKGDFLPYQLKTHFYYVKGYNHCEMNVYKASLKFGEITPEDNPYVKFSLDYDENGRLIEYTRTDDDILHRGVTRCMITRVGDRIIGEHYYKEGINIGNANYYYDNQNRLIVIDLIDKFNKIYKKTKIIYGNNGRITRYEYNSEGEQQCEATDIKDAKGRLIKQTYVEGGATIAETISYNEKGHIQKVNSSKTMVFNGQKSEIYKGRLYDEFRYRYDQLGNITDRLTYSHFMGNEKLEWIKFKYSNIEEEIVEEVPERESISEQPQTLLISSNPNDYFLNTHIDSLNTEETIDINWVKNNIIVADHDNDGFNEGIVLLRDEKGSELWIIGGKKYEETPLYFRSVLHLDEKYRDQCNITFMQHDFDDDGINEFIVGFVYLGKYLNAHVFRWVNTNSKTESFYEDTGSIASAYVAFVDGNTIQTEEGEEYVYQNHKLTLKE